VYRCFEQPNTTLLSLFYRKKPFCDRLGEKLQKATKKQPKSNPSYFVCQSSLRPKAFAKGV
jgi:hypothetical protein